MRDGDEYVISGSKRFISHGSVADLVIVFAVTDPDGDRPPPALVLRRRGRPARASGSRASSTRWGSAAPPPAELTFDDVRIPAGNLLGAEGDGFALAMKTFDRSRPGIAAQAVGIAQGALEVATKYARERKQFGRAIGEFQMISAMLADMEPPRRPPGSFSMPRAWRSTPVRATPRAGRPSPSSSPAMPRCAVTTDAVQVLGGYGYVNEYPVERMMRDAKITQIYEGTQQIQRLVVARALLG